MRMGKLGLAPSCRLKAARFGFVPTAHHGQYHNCGKHCFLGTFDDKILDLEIIQIQQKGR
jgi:hypothetical protein